jgi:hypothetical protein
MCDRTADSAISIKSVTPKTIVGAALPVTSLVGQFRGQSVGDLNDLPYCVRLLRQLWAVFFRLDKVWWCRRLRDKGTGWFRVFSARSMVWQGLF